MKLFSKYSNLCDDTSTLRTDGRIAVAILCVASRGKNKHKLGTDAASVQYKGLQYNTI